MSTPGPAALRALDAVPGASAAWLDPLAAALDGSGPALLPLPVEPAAERRRLVDALRPDDDATVGGHGHQVTAGRRPTALVVPTSGSSGEPKGVVLSVDAVRWSVEATARRLAGHGQWVLALPLTHVAGLMVLARSAVAGTVPVEVAPAVGDGRELAAATARARVGATRSHRPLYVSLVPTQLGRLLDAGVDLRPYDAVLLGGAAPPDRLLERAADAGVRVVVTYGMSETCGGCVYDETPLDGVVVDVDPLTQRVLVGGDMLFDGYRLRPDLTAAAFDAAGRFVTGDIGRLHDDGRLAVLGRADDLIVTGGEKVPPQRVEAVVAGVPGVADAAVVGVVDADRGERVVAVVVVAAGGPVPSLDDVRTHAAQWLSAGWLPRELHVVDRLPLLPSGKIDRAAVRQLAAGGPVAP